MAHPTIAFQASLPSRLSSRQHVTVPVSAHNLSTPLHIPQARRCRPRKGPRMDTPGTGIYAPETRPSDVRVVVFGATGYIGRVVVREFCTAGYSVTAFARRRAGVGGKQREDDVKRDLSPANVVFGEVCDASTLPVAFETDQEYKSTIVVSCLASRTGGIADSDRIDYQATYDVLRAAQVANVRHFVLLSAVCVQKPLLAFQHAKLRFEAALEDAATQDPSFSFAIVRPTAFFKSLAAQVEGMKKGGLYIMFGDGALAKCNALSERDLARFIVLCASDEAKRNQVLPIGGPGQPITPKEQAEMVFRLLGRDPKFLSLPIALMDGIINVLDGLSRVFPGLKDAAEFGRIGKYYATEDMTGPSFGEDTLEAFFADAVKDGGMANQDLGDAKVF